MKLTHAHTQALVTSLEDFVDVINVRGWISASFCEGCQQHAPAEMTPDGHGLAKLGKLVHTDSCPYDRARRLLAECQRLAESKGA